MEMKEVFVGIDVSKASLDVAVIPSGEVVQFANDRNGIDALCEYLFPLSPLLIVLEATGGLERNATLNLAANNLPVVVTNP